MGSSDAPINLLYALLGFFVAGFGAAIVVYQTAASSHALLTRRGLMAGGVVLIVLGGVLLISQVIPLFAHPAANGR